MASNATIQPPLNGRLSSTTSSRRSGVGSPSTVPGSAASDLGVGARLTDRDGRGVQLSRKTRLVAELEDSRLSEKGTHRIARLSADVEPVVRALGVQLDGLVSLARIVLAYDLDEASVARARRLG